MSKLIRLSDHFTYGKLLRFTLPSICMMVFTSIYGVVDGLFVSNFVGKTPFAAVNLVMPFVMILGGMGFMIGTGGTALVSKLLGEGKQEEAHRTFSMLVLFTLLFGAVLSAVGIITMPAVSRLLGASDAMMADCILYGRIVTGFTFAFMLQNVFQSFFIAAEKPRPDAAHPFHREVDAGRCAEKRAFLADEFAAGADLQRDDGAGEGGSQRDLLSLTAGGVGRQKQRFPRTCAPDRQENLPSCWCPCQCRRSSRTFRRTA